MSEILQISGCESSNRKGDLVFIHGLDGDATSTWQADKNPAKSWPAWLGNEFKSIGIWSIGYEVAASHWKGTSMPLYDRATNILALIDGHEFGNHPSIFVTHSLGGLLIKQMIRVAYDSRNPSWLSIAKQIKAIVFLATPHSGSNIANWIEYIGTLLRTTVTVSELKAHDPGLRDLNAWYRDNSGAYGIMTEVYFETQKTSGIQVVDPTSSDPGISNIRPIPVDANHITICKPESKKSLVYLGVKKLVKTLLIDVKPTRQKSGDSLGEASVIGLPAPVQKPFQERIYLSKLPTTSSDLFGREKELKILNEAWAAPHTNILTFVAWGGVGKTALVNEWLNQMQQQNYRGAERVYGWSFYSQGTAEDRQASGDEFLANSLAWFGDPDPKAGAPWDKGVRLAGLIHQQRTLLVLDGLEPLQYPPGAMHGHLKDQGVKALLKELANANPGLCIVTTREWVEDLSHKIRNSVKRVDLEHLSPKAGAALLKNWKVEGTEAELVEASNEFKGHALALNLLGSYLATVHDGEVRKRDLIPQLTEDEERGGHARRVMESYERWLTGTPELGILYLMGLFDRPAAKGAIDALLAPPMIAGLTANLQNLPLAKLQFALHRLRDLNLLAEKDETRPETIDCHPLLREHFGEKLCQQNPAAWKDAHSRLYEYYKNLPAKELPDTLEEIEPLFAAVAHGCQAGRYQETFDEVFLKRIRRGKEHFSYHKLGAFGADLSALSNFFEVLWSRPTSGLRDADEAIVLSWAGFALRALGRLREAAHPMQAGLEAHVQQKNWKESALDAGNLSELYLTLGEVNQAVASARQSVDFADRSGDAPEKEFDRSTLADALHQVGELMEANHLFRETEAMQQQRQPECSYSYSLRGFRFCDLLLNQGQYQEVQKRARQTMKIVKNLLSIALDKLSLGRAFLLQALSEIERQVESFTQARDYLQQAVAGLREAGEQRFVPLGLFARAAFYRSQNEFVPAWADLEEAREIAERGEMKLHLADYHLEACRVCLAEGKMEAGGRGEEKARGGGASSCCKQDDRGDGVRPAEAGGGGVAQRIGINEMRLCRGKALPCLALFNSGDSRFKPMRCLATIR